MALHARRQRLKEYAEREAAGEDLWTEEFSPRVRVRVAAVIDALVRPALNANDVELLAWMFREELGIELQVLAYADPDSVVHLAAGWDLDTSVYPSLIEAVAEVHGVDDSNVDDVAVFESALNEILAEERIAVRLVEGQMVEFRSMEMHAEVVEPVVRLLHRSEGWDKVERSYTDALREIGRDQSNAITDAGTALQEALALLGCEGNALGPLIKDARKRGLIAAHDVKVFDWVSADRSEKGDGHKASAATRDDAWLAVHVVGALILRLASDDGGRDTP
jgi:hypothetical protein